MSYSSDDSFDVISRIIFFPLQVLWFLVTLPIRIFIGITSFVIGTLLSVIGVMFRIILFPFKVLWFMVTLPIRVFLDITFLIIKALLWLPMKIFWAVASALLWLPKMILTVLAVQIEVVTYYVSRLVLYLSGSIFSFVFQTVPHALKDVVWGIVNQVSRWLSPIFGHLATPTGQRQLIRLLKPLVNRSTLAQVGALRKFIQ